MSGDGLRVNVIPLLDEAEFDKLIRTANDKLSNASFSINGVSNDTPTTVSTIPTDVTSGSTSVVTNPDNNEVSLTKRTVESVGREVGTSLNDTIGDESPIIKKLKTLFDSVSALAKKVTNEDGKVATLLNKGMDTIVEYGDELTMMLKLVNLISEFTVGIFDKLKGSSKILNDVWGLVDMAFSIIFMPIGNILAMELMPMVRNMFTKLGDYVGKVLKVYEEEGWSGVIREATLMALDLFFVEFLPTIGETLLEVFASILDPIVGIDFSSAIRGVQAIIQLIKDIMSGEWLDGVVEDTLNILSDIGGVIGDVTDSVVGVVDGAVASISGFFNQLFDTIASLPNTIIEGLGNILSDIGGVIGNVTDSVVGVVNGAVESVSGFFTQLFTTIASLPNAILEGLGNVWSTVASMIGGAVFDRIVPFLSSVAGLVNSILAWLGNYLRPFLDVVQVITSTIYGWLEEFFKLMGTVIDAVMNALNGIGDFVSDPLGALTDAIGGALDGFLGLFGLAKGGIVTAPTPAVFGEAGTEAVIPLDYLDAYLTNRDMETLEMATPYMVSTISDVLNTSAMSSTSSTSSSMSSMRNATVVNVYNSINVYSDDPNRVGNEVKRLLDKSVGKVLSLY